MTDLINLSEVITLDEFIIDKQADFPYSSGELSRLLRDIGFAAKIVHREVNKAGLVRDILGKTGGVNVQGEEVQNLDLYADTRFITALKLGGECSGLVTEEHENYIAFDDPISRSSKYVFAIDPLDGSSNIDVNVSVGTIFSVYRRKSKLNQLCKKDDFLQKGIDQVAAGYIIYGSSTMLVYTAGRSVNGFTLDPSIGEFCLSHPDIKIPKTGKMISVNHGYYDKFPDGVQSYIDYCSEPDEKTNRPYTSRYVGSLVADIHRNLLKGGIYMYPMTSDMPNGKLRLLYECNPMALIVERAGGLAVDGKNNNILDIKAESIHQRTPIFIGSKDMVLKLKKFLERKEN